MTSHVVIIHSDTVCFVCCIYSINPNKANTLSASWEMLQNLGASLERRHLSNKSRPVLITLEKSETRKTLIHKNMVWFILALFQLPHFFWRRSLQWTLEYYGFWIITNIEDKLNWIHKNSHELQVWCVKLCWSINHRNRSKRKTIPFSADSLNGTYLISNRRNDGELFASLIWYKYSVTMEKKHPKLTCPLRRDYFNRTFHLRTINFQEENVDYVDFHE